MWNFDAYNGDEVDGVNLYDLIEEVKKRPVLWDNRLEPSRRRINQSWKRVAEKLGTTAKICSDQWIDLSDIYRIERKRLDRQNLHDEDAVEPPLTPVASWRYYEQMKFVDEYRTCRYRAVQVNRDGPPGANVAPQIVLVRIDSDDEHSEPFNNRPTHSPSPENVCIEMPNDASFNFTLGREHARIITRNHDGIIRDFLGDLEREENILERTPAEDLELREPTHGGGDSNDFNYMLSLMPLINQMSNEQREAFLKTIENAVLQSMMPSFVYEVHRTREREEQSRMAQGTSNQLRCLRNLRRSPWVRRTAPTDRRSSERIAIAASLADN